MYVANLCKMLHLITEGLPLVDFNHLSSYTRMYESMNVFLFIAFLLILITFLVTYSFIVHKSYVIMYKPTCVR